MPKLVLPALVYHSSPRKKLGPIIFFSSRLNVCLFSANTQCNLSNLFLLFESNLTQFTTAKSTRHFFLEHIWYLFFHFAHLGIYFKGACFSFKQRQQRKLLKGMRYYQLTCFFLCDAGNTMFVLQRKIAQENEKNPSWSASKSYLRFDLVFFQKKNLFLSSVCFLSR